MAKKKKKTLGIKTTRYFTKTCSKCRLEYPNWFTNCPKCGVAWNETETVELEESGEPKKKTIKIVVKITEEDFDNKLELVKLIFSADHGKSWYQMRMENELDYYIAEIAEVPIGSLVIYYIEVMLINGEKVIENNEGKYYLYNVGMILEKLEQDTEVLKEQIARSREEAKEYAVINENRVEAHTSLKREIFSNSSTLPDESNDLSIIKPTSKLNMGRKKKNSFIQPPIKPMEYKIEDSLTIFGRPQTQIDPELRICPHCNSKIKKMWSTCPICGKLI